MPELPDPLRQNFRRNAFDGWFGRGINIKYEHRIGQMKTLREFIHQGLRARVTVRLKNHQSPIELAQPSGLKCGADFRRMVAVVVDDGDAGFLTSDLKTPVHAREAFQSTAN